PSKEDLFIYKKPFLDNTYVIYFSNVFDSAQNFESQNVCDVSTNAIVSQINTNNKSVLANEKLQNYGSFSEIDVPNQLMLKDNKDKIEYFSSEFYKNSFFNFSR